MLRKRLSYGRCTLDRSGGQEPAVRPYQTALRSGEEGPKDAKRQLGRGGCACCRPRPV